MPDLPAHVEAFCDALGVPGELRHPPIEIFAAGVYQLEILPDQDRWIVCGVINEFPLPPDSPFLEAMLERPPASTEIGITAYESSRHRLVHWAEIRAGKTGSRPEARLFISELQQILRFAEDRGVL
jgi:hypothetical protein